MISVIPHPKNRNRGNRMNIRKRFLPLLTVFITVALLLLFTGCANFVYVGDSIQVGRYANAEKYQTGNFTYTAADVSEVQINWRFGKISLVESDAAELKVTESGEDLEDYYKLHWLIENGVLYIQFWEAGRIGKADEAKKEITLEIPANVALLVKSTSAPVYAEKLTTLGSATIESVSGDMLIGALSSENAFLTSTSGGIVIAKAKVAKELRVDSNSGTVKVDALSAQTVKIDTTSGKVTVKNPEITGKTEIKTISGKVDIDLGSQSGATVSYETTDAESKITTSRDYVTDGGNYIFGDGGCEISVGSVSGTLTVR